MNLLPNSEWEIWSAVSHIRKPNESGTGQMPDCLMAGYTANSNVVELQTPGHASLAVGDLLIFYPPADPGMQVCSNRILDKYGDRIVIQLPRNLKTAPAVQPCYGYPITVGNWDAISYDAADGYRKDAELFCWRDTWRSNRKAGSKFALGVRQTLASTQRVTHVIGDPNIWPVGIEKFLGREISISFEVWHKFKQGSGSARLRIATDLVEVFSAPTTGCSGYERLELSATIPENATMLYIGVDFNGTPGDVFFLGQPMGRFGSSAGEYEPSCGYFRPIVKLSPWINASFTFPTVLDGSGSLYSFAFDLYAESNGAIAPTVNDVSMQLEARGSTADQAMGFENREVPPCLYGDTISSKMTDKKEVTEGIVPFLNGRGRVHTATPGCSWWNCSLDINGYFFR